MYCGTCLNSYVDLESLEINCDKWEYCSGQFYEPINESFEGSDKKGIEHDKYGGMSAEDFVKIVNEGTKVLFKMINSEDKVKTKNKMTVDQSTYRKNIIEKMDRQIQKGIDKYGTTLEQNNWLKTIDRIVYLQEELIDALVYSEHIIAKLKELNIDLD